MKPSKRYLERLKFVETSLCGKIICARCQCTVLTFADKCSADLSDSCPGFMAIEAAKEKFDGLHKIQLPSTLQ